MTDTNTLAPTDAEILDAAAGFRSQHMHGGTTFDAFDEIGFARAVLAKWGTPVPANHPVVMPEPHYGKGRYLGFARHNDAYSVAQVQAMLAAKTQPTTE